MTTHETAISAVQIPTRTRGTVLTIRAAAALPMAVASWMVAPLMMLLALEELLPTDRILRAFSFTPAATLTSRELS